MNKEINKNKIKSVAVWLIVENGKNKGKIALQKRSEKDGKKFQSFPFICQPTFNGKLEIGESVENAMQREAKEELGKDFKLPNDLSLFDTTNYEFKGTPAVSYNFYAKIQEKDLHSFKLHLGAMPELIFVGKNDLLKIKTIDDKTIDPKEEIVMFKDQYLTLKKLLSIL
jgi:ADP-ribose pyrophosphatase YjhB (NUDIX family)